MCVGVYITVPLQRWSPSLPGSGREPRLGCLQQVLIWGSSLTFLFYLCFPFPESFIHFDTNGKDWEQLRGTFESGPCCLLGLSRPQTHQELACLLLEGGACLLPV